MISTKPKMIVIVAAFAAFLATFNETFLNVAFTPIMTDLNVGVSTVQWLATAYMLGAAVMVPVSAFMYRRIPTKPLFLFSLLQYIHQYHCHRYHSKTALCRGHGHVRHGYGTGDLLRSCFGVISDGQYGFYHTVSLLCRFRGYCANHISAS